MAFENEELSKQNNDKLLIVNNNMGNLRPSKVVEYLKKNVYAFSIDSIKQNKKFNLDEAVNKLLQNNYVTDVEFSSFFLNINQSMVITKIKS
jgi:hypothetical protein